ncbi:hypothetical protein BGX38DRAFT_1191016 [Terfezia claveryi]|nr:hypothetical protein BGX38DRAFT_1191016 [Terfezia claveryi]
MGTQGISTLTSASVSPIPGSQALPEITLTSDQIAFIMSKGPEYFDLLSHQSPSQLNFYMNLTPRQFRFHITVHNKALTSTPHLSSNAESFRDLYTIHFLATGVILQVLPAAQYPEDSPDTPAMAVLKQLIWEKSRHFVDTYGVDGVIQKLSAGEILEYGRMPDCSTPDGEICLYVTKNCIDQIGEPSFEHQSRAGGLLWQIIAEKVMRIIKEEKKRFDKVWYRKAKDIEEVRGLVGPVLYESVSTSRAAHTMEWRDVCSLKPDAS